MRAHRADIRRRWLPPGIVLEPIIYDSAWQFHISGDVVSRFPVGGTMYDPQFCRFASITAADYNVTSSGNTTVFMSDTICYAGMSVIGRLPRGMDTATNLFASGIGFSSGDYSGQPVSNLFDGSLSTYWNSAAACVSGTTYCGVYLSTAIPLKWFKIYNLTSSNQTPNSVILQYYSNDSADRSGGEWVSVATYPITYTDASKMYYCPSGLTAHKSWRLLANQSTGTYWDFYELQGGI